MKVTFKMLSGGLILSGLLALGGCGSSSDTPVAVVVPPPVTATTAVDTTKIVAGTVAGTVKTTAPVTVAAPASAPAAVAKVSVAIPTATVITAKDASGAVVPISAPKIVFSAPGDATATSGGTPPSSSGIKSASSIINIALDGVTSATFSNPIAVAVPYSGATVGSQKSFYIETGGKLTNKAVDFYNAQFVQICICSVIDFYDCAISSVPANIYSNPVSSGVASGSAGGN